MPKRYGSRTTCNNKVRDEILIIHGAARRKYIAFSVDRPYMTLDEMIQKYGIVYLEVLGFYGYEYDIADARALHQLYGYYTDKMHGIPNYRPTNIPMIPSNQRL